MADGTVTESMKREIWRRDDFTCRCCGRIVVWEDLRLVPSEGPDGVVKEGADGLMSVCAGCLEEGKNAPVADEGDRKLLRLKREMEELSASEEGMVLDRDRNSGKLALENKVKDLGSENRKLIDELNDKTSLAIAYKKKLDRALQDLENNRRRTENEIALKVRDRTKAMALSMMGSIDNLDRALKDAEKRRTDPKAFDGLLAGIRNVRKALLSELSGSGMEIIDPEGSVFDPNYHEAVGSIEDKNIPSDTVVMVLSTGCILDGKVLRPARVMVSRGGPKRQRERPGPEAEEDMECLDEDEEWGPEGTFEVENGAQPIRMGPPPVEDARRMTSSSKVAPRKCRKRKG